MRARAAAVAALLLSSCASPPECERPVNAAAVELHARKQLTDADRQTFTVNREFLSDVELVAKGCR